MSTGGDIRALAWRKQGHPLEALEERVGCTEGDMVELATGGASNGHSNCTLLEVFSSLLGSLHLD